MAKKDQGTIIDTTEVASTDVAEIPPGNEDAILALLSSMGEQVVDTAEDVSMAIAERILRAESVDQLLAPQGTTHARDIIGKPLVILDAHWLESTIEGDGPPVYAVLDCLVDGEPTAVTCGARTVMIQVLKAKSAGWLPMACMVEESSMRTKAGFFPMWLAAVGQPVVSDAAQTDEESF